MRSARFKAIGGGFKSEANVFESFVSDLNPPPSFFDFPRAIRIRRVPPAIVGGRLVQDSFRFGRKEESQIRRNRLKTNRDGFKSARREFNSGANCREVPGSIFVRCLRF